jgi:AmmeMemoRadiSam system protein A
MATSLLTNSQGQTMVTLARYVLMEKLGRTPPDKSYRALKAKLAEPCFDQVAGVFVTLSLNSHLRGCIGSLEGTTPLREEVHRNALKAAFEDQRFKALSIDELERIHIEVSILTPPQNLKYSDMGDLVKKLRPGIDGVTLKKGLLGATFLPQVWDHLAKPEQFLGQLCIKAGLPEKEWQTGSLKIETYQVQSFEEPCETE